MSVPHGYALFFGIGQPTDIELVKNKVKDQVTRAINLYQRDGDAALDIITHRGDFREGEIYVGVISSEGVNVAHAFDPSLVGMNIYDLQDSSGAYIIREILTNAVPEGSWHSYMFTNPLSGLEEPKQVWVKKVGNLMFGSGYYPDVEQLVQQQVTTAIARYQEIGENVFEEINEGGDDYVYGEVYVYALGVDGINRAHATRPDIVGTDRLQRQDSTGLFYIQALLEKVTSEGIWFHYRFWSPVTEKEESKRIWAVKFDDIVWVSGYYP